MSEVLRQLASLERSGEGMASGRRAALATLVGVTGSSSKRLGATMVVGPGGEPVGSVTIGGCVDAQVVAAAARVLDTGAPRLTAVSLDDDEAAAIGLTCGGTVEVLVEPIARGDALAAAYDAARRELESGRPVALATVLPEGGARLVVGAAGIVHGTLGDTALDGLAAVHAMRAMRALRAGASAGAKVASVRTIALESRLYVECLTPAPTLVVVGAGEIGAALAAIATVLGWRVTVVDGRAQQATAARFPGADVRVGSPSEIVVELATPGAAIVLVAHDYKYELPVLREVLRRDVAYVGMLGSRKRGASVKALLADEGFGDEALARIRTPIGLDLGGQTPAEIALAIAAEIVAVRAGRAGGALGVAPPAGSGLVSEPRGARRA